MMVSAGRVRLPGSYPAAARALLSLVETEHVAAGVFQVDGVTGKGAALFAG